MNNVYQLKLEPRFTLCANRHDRFNNSRSMARTTLTLDWIRMAITIQDAMAPAPLAWFVTGIWPSRIQVLTRSTGPIWAQSDRESRATPRPEQAAPAWVIPRFGQCYAEGKGWSVKLDIGLNIRMSNSICSTFGNCCLFYSAVSCHIRVHFYWKVWRALIFLLFLTTSVQKPIY